MTQFVNNDVSSGNIVYASDHNTQGALVAAVLNGGIENENIAADAAINTDKISFPATTTDSNGWTVYEHGSHRSYCKRIVVGSTGSLASLGVTAIAAGNYPTGVAPANLYIVCNNGTADADNSGRFFMNATNQNSSTPGTSYNINVRNLTGSTLSPTNLVANMICVDLTSS